LQRNEQAANSRATVDKLIASIPPDSPARAALDESRKNIPGPVDCDLAIQKFLEAGE